MIGLVAAETVRPGDLIRLPVVGTRTVSTVEVEDGIVWIVYFGDETAYENRASAARGARSSGFIVERFHKPLQVGDPIQCRRGDPEDAEELRQKMVDAEALRFARAYR